MDNQNPHTLTEQYILYCLDLQRKNFSRTEEHLSLATAGMSVAELVRQGPKIANKKISRPQLDAAAASLISKGLVSQYPGRARPIILRLTPDGVQVSQYIQSNI